MRIILFNFLCFKHEFRIQWWNIQEWRVNNSWFKSNNDDDDDDSIRCNKTHKGTWQLGKWHWIFDVVHCNECWFREYLACKLSGRVEHNLLKIIKLNPNLFFPSFSLGTVSIHSTWKWWWSIFDTIFNRAAHHRSTALLFRNALGSIFKPKQY